MQTSRIWTLKTRSHKLLWPAVVLGIWSVSLAAQFSISADTAAAAERKPLSRTQGRGYVMENASALVTNAEATQILGSPASRMPGGIIMFTAPNGSALLVQRLPAAYFHANARASEYHPLSGFGDKAVYSSANFTANSKPSMRVVLLILKGKTTILLDARRLATKGAPVTPQARTLLLSKLERVALKAITRLP